MLTISMTINFNNIVETSNLQQSYTQYLYSIQIVKNNYSKPGTALVKTISSSKYSNRIPIESTNTLVQLINSLLFIAYMKNNVRTVILLTLACENNVNEF